MTYAHQFQSPVHKPNFNISNSVDPRSETTVFCSPFLDLHCLRKVQKACLPFNALPNGKILHWSKFKTLADDKINVAEMMISLPDRVKKRGKKRKC